jgi:hypothetical protein
VSPSVKSVARLLLLAGAAGVVASGFLPWVTVKGVALHLDLIGADVTPGSKTVAGTETSAFPAVAGVGAAVAFLALFNIARKLLLLLGLLITVAGGGLLYYVLNIVDIETSGRSALEQAVAGALITSSTGPGPPLLLASGIVIFLGALAR